MRTAFFIPTYNEAENLPTLVERLLALEPPIDVVVVDDASPDGTGDIADALAAARPARPRHPPHRAAGLLGGEPRRSGVVPRRRATRRSARWTPTSRTTPTSCRC